MPSRKRLPASQPDLPVKIDSSGANSNVVEPVANQIYTQVCEILQGARQRSARSINVEMVRAYWHIGQLIVEHEQQGQERAGYGDQLIETLATRFAEDNVKGFSRNNLWYMRQFYLTYPQILHAMRGELSWTHYRLLLKVDKPEARAFYETEAAHNHWSTRELERQIGSLFYERALGPSRGDEPESGAGSGI